MVLRGVPRNAAKPISAACWYRMNAAGSTSPWSLSFRSPSPLVLSFFLSLPLPLLFTYPYFPSLSLQAVPPSFSLFLSRFHPLALSHPRLFLWRGNPSMVARKPPAVLSPATFLPFRSSLFRCSARAFSLSLLFSLLSFWPCGGWFIGFIGASARALRILFSNYTVTCNRPCQLATPFFHSSSALLFSPPASSCPRYPAWRATPSKGSLREEKGGGRAKGGSVRDRTRQLILRILRVCRSCNKTTTRQATPQNRNPTKINRN